MKALRLIGIIFAVLVGVVLLRGAFGESPETTEGFHVLTMDYRGGFTLAAG